MGRTKGISKMELLVAWKKRPFVDKMLDDGLSPNKVATWVNENGLDISTPTIYTYSRKRKEAIMRDVKIETLLADKRKTRYKDKDGNKTDGSAKSGDDEESYADSYGGKVVKESTSRKSKSKKSKKGSGTGKKQTYEERARLTPEDKRNKQKRVDHVKSDLEILDGIIDKGWKTLHMMEVISPDMAIKAISLKNKITGGSHNGITTYGLEEIRLREAARENAIVAVLLEFIPEDKHEEVIERMETETKKYYESIGMGEAYEVMTEDEDEAVET